MLQLKLNYVIESDISLEWQVKGRGLVHENGNCLIHMYANQPEHCDQAFNFEKVFVFPRKSSDQSGAGLKTSEY